MAQNYKWRSTTTYESDTSLSYGVTPNTQSSWQTASAGTQNSRTWTYWWRDSNTTWQGTYQDALSSRCAVSVTQSWTASIDAHNVLTVVINTTINSIIRDDIQAPTGYSDQNTPGRVITLYDDAGNQVAQVTDNQVATAHTIMGTPVTLPQRTFTIQPGSSLTKSSLQAHNQTVGGQSYDDILIGVEFQNPMDIETVYKISYNGNGGSPVPASMSTTSSASSVTLYVATAPIPSYGSYKFLGWSLTQIPGSGTAADVDYNPGNAIILYETNPQITLYAVWEHDYRPGAVYNGSNDWLSHNRSAGRADIYDGSTWNTMRTLDGGTGTGNPPEIYDGTTWHNMRKIGTE